jgi:hypothetical protein
MKELVRKPVRKGHRGERLRKLLKPTKAILRWRLVHVDILG